MNLNRAWLFSPTAPALLLLFGLTFGFAIAHITGLTWATPATSIYYGGLFLWGAGVLVKRRQMLRQLGLIDYLFLVFFVLIVASLAMQQQGNAGVAYYAKLLPFLVLLPYCLGRLTEKPDLDAIMRALPGLGVLLLVLTVVDYWWMPDNEIIYTRGNYFGINHSPLLIAMLVCVAMLALAHGLVKKSAVEQPEPGWKLVLVWCAFGGMAMASVVIAARGALIASTLALVLMMAAMRGLWLSKTLVLGCFALVTSVTLYMLQTPKAQFYARLQSIVDEVPALVVNSSEYTEMQTRIKSDPQCKPIVDGVNSVAIRRVLYQESIDMALQHPLLGVGATNFGRYSCGGLGAYPHSSVLQAFAELGVVGGGVLLALFVISFASVARARVLIKSNASDHVFWLALIAFFGLIDQIYGNYFMAVGSFFLFGVVARNRIRSDTFLL